MKRLHVTIHLYGRTTTGTLTPITGWPNAWWLHSTDYLVDVLLFDGRELRWKHGTRDLVAQLDYFTEVMISVIQ